MNPDKNKYFKNSVNSARDLLKDKKRLNEMLGNALNKTDLLKDKSIYKSVIGKIKVLVNMVKAYINGRYRNIPWDSILKLSAALIYFVMPLDLIPDFIPATGLIDDFTIILWVWNSLEKDIEKFTEWEQAHE